MLYKTTHWEILMNGDEKMIIVDNKASVILNELHCSKVYSNRCSSSVTKETTQTIATWPS